MSSLINPAYLLTNQVSLSFHNHLNKSHQIFFNFTTFSICFSFLTHCHENGRIKAIIRRNMMVKCFKMWMRKFGVKTEEIRTISIQFKKNITQSIKMSVQNIFLDDDTYLKRNHSIDQLIRIQKKGDSKEIAKFFTFNHHYFTELKEVIKHQIDQVIEYLPQKHKPIMKNKMRGYLGPKRQKNGILQESVKDIHGSNSHTKEEHEIHDFFNVTDEAGLVLH